MDENKEFRNSIHDASVVLLLDAEKGEGETLAEQFNVHGYPTYIVLNADGKTVDMIAAARGSFRGGLNSAFW